MAKRYIPSSRTTTEDAQAAFLDSLNSQAQKLLAEMAQQFLRDLQSQTSDILGGGGGGGSDSGDTLFGLGRFLAPATRLLFSRSSSTSQSQSTQESSRSQDAGTQFRLSQSQAMAEAGHALARGDKNT